MRKKTVKHTTLPDPKFGDVQVTKFVNNLMYDGKKSKSLDIFYSAIDIVPRRAARKVWRCSAKPLTNVTPQVEVRSRRVGGANFQIPQAVREDRKKSLAMKWLIGYARNRNERSMANETGERDPGRFERRGWSIQEEGRDPQDGRGEQGIQPLPLLITTVERARSWPRGT
jgi:small subunit ribosomal protein S7